MEKVIENFHSKELSEDYIVQRVDIWNRSYQKIIKALVRRKKEIMQNQESKMAK